LDVTALVINFNAGDLLVDCVESLLENGADAIRVVDNASEDGSFERLRERFEGERSLNLVANRNNPGFGPAINAQLSSVHTEALLVINPDCRLAPGALASMAGAMAADGRLGLVGPAVLDPAGRLEAAACRHFPTPWRSLMTFSGLHHLAGRWPALAGVMDRQAQGSFPDGKPVPVDATSGACMLFRRAALEAVGGFDTAYRLHCEDLDVMYRLREKGYRVQFLPAARATHVQGVSSASRPLWVHWQKHRGMRRFFDQHQAADYPLTVRWLVRFAIHLRALLLAPLALLRR